MADVLFTFDVDAAPAKVLETLKTADGLRGFWTTTVEVPSEVGESLSVGFFNVMPTPFDLRLEQSDDKTVVWRTETFPPHWIGTTVRWDVEPREGGASVAFRHGTFPDEDAGSVAYTWVRSWWR